jgi:hypothetical protein
MVGRLIVAYHSTREYLIDVACAGFTARNSRNGAQVRGATTASGGTLARWRCFNLAIGLLVNPNSRMAVPTSAPAARRSETIRGKEISSTRPPLTYELQICCRIYWPVEIQVEAGRWKNIHQTQRTPVLAHHRPGTRRQMPAILEHSDRSHAARSASSRARSVSPPLASGAAIHCGRSVFAYAACRRPRKMATLLTDYRTPTRAP